MFSKLKKIWLITSNTNRDSSAQYIEDSTWQSIVKKFVSWTQFCKEFSWKYFTEDMIEHIKYDNHSEAKEWKTQHKVKIISGYYKRKRT